jgi:hypothetical protein
VSGRPATCACDCGGALAADYLAHYLPGHRRPKQTPDHSARPCGDGCGKTIDAHPAHRGLCPTYLPGHIPPPAYFVRTRQRWRSEDRCYQCGRPNDRKPKLLCKRCARRATENSKRYQRRRRAAAST